jgi:DNA-binding NtrC family response regulator
LASAGRFRHALYQRLVTVEIALPPLRERMEDIPELARHLVERVARLHGRSMLGIAEEAMMQLQKHCWPGNVRELCDVIQGGVVRSNSDFIEARHLVFARSTGTERLAADMDASVRLEDVVERHVLGVLKECGGNKLRAAEMLGISRSTLYRMLEAGGSEAVLR